MILDPDPVNNNQTPEILGIRIDWYNDAIRMFHHIIKTFIMKEIYYIKKHVKQTKNTRTPTNTITTKWNHQNHLKTTTKVSSILNS